MINMEGRGGLKTYSNILLKWPPHRTAYTIDHVANRKKAEQGKRIRMDEDKLKGDLFKLFEKHQVILKKVRLIYFSNHI